MTLHLKSVAGALFGIGCGQAAVVTHLPLLMAPLGPTSVLIFAQPQNPSAQPVNVFGGYFLAAFFGVAAEVLLPGTWWAATWPWCWRSAMLLFRVTHPPAAAVPLVLLGSPMEPVALFGIMLASCIVLVLVAIAHHHLPPRMIYPRRAGRQPAGNLPCRPPLADESGPTVVCRCTLRGSVGGIKCASSVRLWGSSWWPGR